MVNEKDINEYNDRLERLFGLDGTRFPCVYAFRNSQYRISVNLNNCIEYYLVRKLSDELGDIIVMLCKVAGVEIPHGGHIIAWNSIRHHFYKKLNPMSKYGELGAAKRAERIAFTTLLEVTDSLRKLRYN